ncbi:hypothetical protein ADUPG1_010894, partial [Aduncisulcus paluster]
MLDRGSGDVIVPLALRFSHTLFLNRHNCTHTHTVSQRGVHNSHLSEASGLVRSWRRGLHGKKGGLHIGRCVRDRLPVGHPYSISRILPSSLSIGVCENILGYHYDPFCIFSHLLEHSLLLPPHCLQALSSCATLCELTDHVEERSGLEKLQMCVDFEESTKTWLRWWVHGAQELDSAELSSRAQSKDRADERKERDLEREDFSPGTASHKAGAIAASLRLSAPISSRKASVVANSLSSSPLSQMTSPQRSSLGSSPTASPQGAVGIKKSKKNKSGPVETIEEKKTRFELILLVRELQKLALFASILHSQNNHNESFSQSLHFLSPKQTCSPKHGYIADSDIIVNERACSGLAKKIDNGYNCGGDVSCVANQRYMKHFDMSEPHSLDALDVTHILPTHSSTLIGEKKALSPADLLDLTHTSRNLILKLFTHSRTARGDIVDQVFGKHHSAALLFNEQRLLHIIAETASQLEEQRMMRDSARHVVSDFLCLVLQDIIGVFSHLFSSMPPSFLVADIETHTKSFTMIENIRLLLLYIADSAMEFNHRYQESLRNFNRDYSRRRAQLKGEEMLAMNSGVRELCSHVSTVVGDIERKRRQKEEKERKKKEREERKRTQQIDNIKDLDEEEDLGDDDGTPLSPSGKLGGQPLTPRQQSEKVWQSAENAQKTFIISRAFFKLRINALTSS